MLHVKCKKLTNVNL